MSTQISKRALSAGLGVGALALLAQTQRASADTSFTSFAFPATGTPTPRTMPDRLAEVVNVKDFGALGDGTTDDTAAIQAALNAAYGSSGSPHGATAAIANRPVFFPNGTYKITSPLHLTNVRGAHIYGGGRFTTTIQNTNNGSVFVTNGCEYSRFERLNLAASGTGVCFDLDWNNTGSTALQSNTFSDIFFQYGAYGLRIGQTGYMGSETLIMNCYFIAHSVAGIATRNYNALQQTVIGGNIAQCAIGIWVFSGSVPTIHGVGFQGQTDTDIAVDNSASDVYSINGCRTESMNFGRFHSGPGVHMSGCTQTNSSAGIFAFIEAGTPGSLMVDGCHSVNGTIIGNGSLYIRGSSFQNVGYLSSFAGAVKQNI